MPARRPTTSNLRALALNEWVNLANKSVFITRVSASLPNDPVPNDQMEDLLGKVGGKPSRARRMILKSNGIVTRHYVLDPKGGPPTHNNAQLTAEAVRKLEGGGFRLRDMQLLACGTSSQDYIHPNHGLMVLGELKSPPCEVVAITGICISGVNALKVAYLNVLAGLTENAVATGSEVVSTVLLAKNFEAESQAKVDELAARPEIAFEKDFLRWMLSDGAGAVLLENKPNPQGLSLRIDWIDQRSYAGELGACMYAGALKQPDGSLKAWRDFDTMDEVVRHSVFTVQQDVKLLNEHIIPVTIERGFKDTLRKHPMQPGEIDYFLPHYSSNYFRDKVYQGFKNIGFEIPYDRWFTNLPTKGNIGAAAFLVMLEELFHSGRLKAGQRILGYIPESSRFSTSFVQLTVVEP
jgi:3-oxoacyl-[acyl-carrier-protein] synthase-3